MFLQADNNFDAIQKVVALIKQEVDTANEKANDTLPQPIPVGQYPSTGNYFIKIFSNSVSLTYPSYWFKDYSYYSSNGQDMTTVAKLDSRRLELLALVDKLDVDIQTAIDTNKAAIENNKKIVDKVTLMMKHIGIPSSYTTSEFKTSRSRTKTSTTHTAGYINDLWRCIPTTIKGSKPDTKQLRDSIEKAYKTQVESVRAIETAKAKADAEVKNNHVLALLRAKYTPDNAFSDKSDIQEVIINKNKYLRLAHYLECNRNDWNDGCDYAENGINAFTVENTLDEDINTEIQGLVDDWGNHADGRIFRDCQYNYTYLYGLVDDEQLMADYQEIARLIYA